MTHSPLPWSACHNGECSCKQIWTADYPILTVNSGAWGDKYPSLRFVEGTGGAGSLKPQIEAYTDMIEYGKISEEIATGNAQFIVKAVNNHEKLLGTVVAINKLLEMGLPQTAKVTCEMMLKELGL